MSKRLTLLFILFVVICTIQVSGVDFWRYPEAADRGAIFAGAFGPSVSFSLSNIRSFNYQLNFPELYLDYVLPIGLPFSFGFSLRPFQGGILGVGIRPAYHINLRNPRLNFYIMYALDVSVSADYLLLEYGGRAGIRYRFGNSIFCINIETGFKLQSIKIGAALKLN